jgi:hypothetical protein
VSGDVNGAVGGLSLDSDGDGTGGDSSSEVVYVAIPGDTNLDGTVDVLGDAFALVGNLGTAGNATWAQGDFNNDGNVDVLGDAFTLVGNLGRSVLPPSVVMANFASTSPLQRTPVLIQASPNQSEAADESRQKKTLPVSEFAPALAGSQSLDEAFASEDWLV